MTNKNDKIIDGQKIKCPHCKGSGGRFELLYYWVDCYLCEGRKEFVVDKVIERDPRGEIKATITITHSIVQTKTKTLWII